MSPTAGVRSDQRWRLLVPEDALVVDLAQPSEGAAVLRAQPPGTPVAIVGGPRARRLARRYAVTTHRVFLAVPGLDEPVVVAEVTEGALAWFTGQVLTVPSGRRRGHGLMWVAVLIARRWPRLLMHASIGDRIVIGARR